MTEADTIQTFFPLKEERKVQNKKTLYR